MLFLEFYLPTATVFEWRIVATGKAYVASRTALPLVAFWQCLICFHSFTFKLATAPAYDSNKSRNISSTLSMLVSCDTA